MEQVIVGRYTLGALVGAGGMAQVVEGRDTRLDRRVAIKLVPAAAIDPAGRERFRREARSSAHFSHPNVVATYDAGEADGYLYLVMELVDGPSLAARLSEAGPLAVDEALHIADGILAALQAAHAAGIVHRDVKPGNVLLDRHGVVKLADFGIARRLDDLSSDLTGAGLIIGTPGYLAPEQVAGQPASPASDLYATSIVLYEMLSGSAPYAAGTPMATAVAHQTAPIPDLGAVRRDAPSHVVAAVARAMAKDPARRFRSAAAMRAALSRASLPATAVSPLPAPVVSSARAVSSSTAVLPPTAEFPSTVVSPPTAVGERAGRFPRRPGRWWLGSTIALLAIAAIVIAVARISDDADPIAAPGTLTSVPATAPATPAPADILPTTAAPTTAEPTPPASTPLATAPPPTTPSSPQTVSELIGLLAATPDLYGAHTDDLRNELEKIEREGRDAPARARRLLDRTASWVDDGELDAAVLPLLDALIGPLAATDQGRDNGDEDD